MVYSVKEVFLTLQGEGFHSGKTALFIRFSGCNLWNGKESGRKTAQCKFCDTDFVGTDGDGGGKFSSADQLVQHCNLFWRGDKQYKFCVITGGEPLLQLDQKLINALHKEGYYIAIETNGTLACPDNIDWICVSPKTKDALKIQKGNELKFIYPQIDLKAEDYQHLDFEHFYIQPMDNKDHAQNLSKAIQYCLDNPQWKLSLQTHKIMDIR